jgi:hypothetical protein
MGRRPGRDLEKLPHYVYIHLDSAGRAIYVGRTSDPDFRPQDDRKRKWIAAESRDVLLSPAMPFDVAAWVEASLIQTMAPRHNQRSGQTNHPAAEDWRIDRICEAENVTRAYAKWAVRYFPKDRDEFEAVLADRLKAIVDFTDAAADAKARAS